MTSDLPNREELLKAVMLGLVAREELTEPELEALFPAEGERRKTPAMGG